MKGKNYMSPREFGPGEAPEDELEINDIEGIDSLFEEETVRESREKEKGKNRGIELRQKLAENPKYFEEREARAQEIAKERRKKLEGCRKKFADLFKDSDIQPWLEKRRSEEANYQLSLAPKSVQELVNSMDNKENAIETELAREFETIQQEKELALKAEIENI